MEQKGKPCRVLLGKMGLDGHDRGVLMIAFALRDAGFEVVYTGIRQSPESVAKTAVQEDVDLVGISSLADAHRTLVPRLIQELRKLGSNVPVLLGGFIQPEDVTELKSQGVAEVFPLNSKLDDIVSSLRQYAMARS